MNKVEAAKRNLRHSKSRVRGLQFGANKRKNKKEKALQIMARFRAANPQ